MYARRPSMSTAVIFAALCAAMVLALSRLPTSQARAQDEGDSCGSAILEDDDTQVDANAQAGANGRGLPEWAVDDENGDDVDDMDDMGNPDDDVDVDVEVLALSGPNQGTVVTSHSAQNGSFVLKGLPKGRVTVTATRTHNGVTTTATRKKSAREGRTKHMRLRLRPAS